MEYVVLQMQQKPQTIQHQVGVLREQRVMEIQLAQMEHLIGLALEPEEEVMQTVVQVLLLYIVVCD